MLEVSRQKKLEVLLGYIRSDELFDETRGRGSHEAAGIDLPAAQNRS
ncbi:MAG: hypothetical protein Q8R44_01545 [Novosphingobium sp.]|nr:hypothetical protein [Novosphingobium sp.]